MSSRINETERAFHAEIGKNIKNWRNKRGVSQVNVAEPMDVSFQQVQKYENGTNRTPILAIMRFAKFANVPIRELMPESFNDLY